MARSVGMGVRKCTWGMCAVPCACCGAACSDAGSVRRERCLGTRADELSSERRPATRANELSSPPAALWQTRIDAPRCGGPGSTHRAHGRLHDVVLRLLRADSECASTHVAPTGPR